MMRPRPRFLTWLCAVALLPLVSAVSAQSTRKPITQDVYDLWRTISGATLSPDGKWAAYTVSPVVGEGDLVLRATGGTTEYRQPRGYTGRAQLLAAADSAAQFSPQPAEFSADSRFVAFVRYPPKRDVEAARRTPSGPPVPQPRNSLGIVSVSDGSATWVQRVRSFRFARDGGRYLAYLLESDTAAAVSRLEPGSTLIVRELATGAEARIESVTSYLFDEGERVLAYTTAAADHAKDGAWIRELASGTVMALASGKGNYRSLALDRHGAQAAFVSDRDEPDAAVPRYALYYASLEAPKGSKTIAPAQKVVSAGTVGGSVVIADHGRVDFVRDGSALQFALAPAPRDTIPSDSLFDKAVYDLWHWQDTKLQPQQRIDAARDRNRTWAAVYQPAVNRWVRLGTDSLTDVTLADNGRIALALDSVEYAIAQTWGEGGSDAFLVDPTSGARTLVAKHLAFGATLSPSAKYVTFFADGRWQAHAVATGKKVDLTAGIKDVRFENELFDMPDARPSYGLGGWVKDDARVLVYDRFDVWEVDPAGVALPRNLTAGAGRQKGITYRVVNLGGEDRFLDPARPLIVRAFDNETKASGYAKASLGASSSPETLVMGPKNYGALQKARKAEQYLMTQQTYREFPDLWTGAAIASLARISNANPQENEYTRGDVELVSWYNDDGIRLQGLLYKPERFDPSKKYPMITYFYERLSDGLHNYLMPTGTNNVNPHVYSSLGYLVFEPDIVYTEGFPGPSAAKAIVPGVQSLIARGFVDPKRLGISGQSWGGYQTAYVITVTHMFAAAVPNATVVNMTSAYGGIRWGPGISRQWQYEHNQSRIGGSLWEYPERYIENSPLFKLDRVTTPVFFMADDADNAVPWYQGIEFYLAMRRLKKEAYLIVFNGDVHNPTKRANQKEIDKKMQEFFANKLLGAPAPEWMVHGIPYLDKGRDQLKKATTTGAEIPEESESPRPQLN